jgi:hypothetical protein
MFSADYCIRTAASSYDIVSQDVPPHDERRCRRTAVVGPTKRKETTTLLHFIAALAM